MPRKERKSQLNITVEGPLIERFNEVVKRMSEHDDFMEWGQLHRSTVARMALADFIRTKERELGVTPRR
jgi:hypothetical protein